MKLSIIIVGWKTRNLLEVCLASVYKQAQNLDFEVFVVENNSQDGTCEMIRSQFPQVLLIDNSVNVGFAKANNIAIKRSHGDYILLLNPDTEVLDSAIDKTMSFMEKTPDAGVVGCRLLNKDLSLQLSCRTFPTLISQIWILLKLHNFFTRQLKSIVKYYMLDFKHDTIKEVDQVMGAFLMTKRSVINNIGMLDERFWILFEEVDFCKRVKESGLKVYFYPLAEIVHNRSSSFKQESSLRRQKFFNRSLLKYFKKHHSLFAYLVLLILQPISYSLALLTQALFYCRIKLHKPENL